MIPHPSLRVSSNVALCLCLVAASSSTAAPKKKETSGTLGNIRAGQPKAPSAPGKPAPAPKKTAGPRKPAAPRPTVKLPSPKPAVVAQPPAPTLPTLYVSPDGKSPYKSIAAALAKAPNGARVLVRTGIYAESLHLTRPVEIAPASPNDAVVIESPRGPAVLMRTDKATVRQITLRQIPGAGVGDYTVEVPQGNLALEGCTVQGGDKAAVGVHGSGTAPRLRKCDLRGKVRGLHLFGSAKATLEQCTLTENSEFGAQVESGGELTVRATRFGGNGQDGLSVHTAAALVDDCDFSANKRHGLWVHESTITATRSRVYDSGLDGVWCENKSTGTVEGCEIYRSGRTGIVLHREADLRFTACKSYNNTQQGLVSATASLSRFENCEFTGNATVGIIIQEKANPTLRKCQIASPERDAIMTRMEGRGLFEDCVVTKGGGSAGVAVHTQSSPTFRRTRFSGGWWGAYFEKGSGEFEDCDFSNTAGPTVYVLSGSSPKLILCRIRDSKERGVVFATASTGILDRCVITGSTGAGLALKDAATNPSIANCTIAGGKAQGLHVELNARGTLLDCTIARNGGAGVGIHSGGATLLKHCRIENNSMGVQVSHDGAGVLDGCLITGNAGHGVEIVVNGNPLVKGCTVKQNRGAGIVVSGTGRGTIEGPVLEQNAGGNLQVPAGGRTIVRGAAGN